MATDSELQDVVENFKTLLTSVTSELTNLAEQLGEATVATNNNTEEQKKTKEALKSVDAALKDTANAGGSQVSEQYKKAANYFGNRLSGAGGSLPLSLQRLITKNFKASAKDSDAVKSLKYSLQGFFQASSFKQGVTTAGLSSFRAAGFLGGVGTVALVTAAWSLKAAMEQVGKILSENLSPKLLAQSFASALQTEFLTGRFRPGEQGAFGLHEFSIYRNQMRMLGIRDDKEIAKALSDVVSQGIAGGIARADAVNAAISKAAIQKTLGIDLTGDTIGGLYRATRGNRDLFSNKYGDFDLQRFAQNFANLARASEDVNGVQVSIREWYGIFDKLKTNFRGTSVDFEAFQRGLSRFSKSLTENQMQVSDVVSLYSASRNMSDSAMFKMFAFSGTSGENLFDERLSFIRRGMTGNVGYNALEIAKHILNYGNITGGSDEAKRDYFMRAELRNMGLGTLAQNVSNLDKLFGSILSGDDSSRETFDKLAKDTNLHLIDQGEKLDALRSPVEHIRDLLFGVVANSWVVRKLVGSVDTVLKKGAEVVGGIDKEYVKDYSAAVRNDKDSKNESLTYEKDQAISLKNIEELLSRANMPLYLGGQVGKSAAREWLGAPMGDEE